MTTIYYLNGVRFFIWSNDHPPAHVHVSSQSKKWEIVIHIGNCGNAKPKLHAQKGKPNYADIKMALQEVATKCSRFDSEWRRIHG
jgi:hypothetical protein